MRYALLMVGILLLSPGMETRAGGEAARLWSPSSGTGGRTAAQQWLGRDFYLVTGEVLSCETDPAGQLLLCQGGSSVTVGGQQWTSDTAVIWIRTGGATDPARRYNVQMFLKGKVSHKQTGDTQNLGIQEVAIEKGRAVVLKTSIDGEVFVTAKARRIGSPSSQPLYAEATAGFGKAGLVVPVNPAPPAAALAAAAGRKERAGDRTATYYTMTFSPLGETPPTLQWSKAGDTEIVTWIGRTYASWQEQGDGANPRESIELQADTFVAWRKAADAGPLQVGQTPSQLEGVSEVYVAGDVLLREGQRVIRATELYYDLQNKRGLARNAVLRTFDPTRAVPIYVRAKELRQLGENRYEGDKVSVTTSEFWTPQISASASKVRIIDTIKDADSGKPIRDSSYTARMKDVRLKYYDMTLFWLPSMQGDLLNPQTPLKSVSVGQDSTFGTSIETQWFLSRLLGLREPEGTKSTLFLDYYSKRGPGGGIGVEYERENYFGRVLGYAIYDQGEDRLGRTRKSVEVPQEGRGRFSFQHRQYLPDSWQLTAEVGYLSDRNFLEQYYRREFYASKEPETLLHAKRIEDNFALAFLGKVNINDFQPEVEELPSAEYHWTGQSFLYDHFVFFSDSLASQLRYHYGQEGGSEPEDFFHFVQTRNEVDMPLRLGRSKVVPFVAGTFAYDDGGGFHQELDEPFSGAGKDTVWLGQAGVRTSLDPFWRLYPDAESELWDVHGLRHTIRPSLAAVGYLASNEVVDQRDMLDFEILQKWQTKRGPPGHRRAVDWLSMAVDFVWVSNSGQETAGPDRFVWNEPSIPFINRTGNRVPPFDRRSTNLFGPQRNYASAEGTWRLTETTSVLGDLYVDMQSWTTEQADLGVSRLVWPNLSYYIGSRYLRDVDNGLGQHGSNAVTFALTYLLDPRYTLVLSEQYDFDYEANIRSNLTLIRKYHRVNFAVSVSVDDSLDEQRIVFSLWPEGVPELAIGLRRYMGLGTPESLY